jgi:outer membrane lipoprotein-sorting protein
MKKGYLVIGVCLLVFTLCLATACGGGDEEETTTATTGAATTTTTHPATHTTTPTSATPGQTTTTSTATVNPLTELLSKWTGQESVRYDLVVTLPDQLDKVTGHICQTHNKQRMEYTMEGETVVMIFLLDENIMYTYMPDQNMATKMTLDTSQMAQGTQTGDMPEILEREPSIVGTDTIDGIECTVISFSPGGETDVTLWVWTDTGFPIRTESITSDGKQTIMEYKNIDFSDIPDSVFEIPEGVQIIEM